MKKYTKQQIITAGKLGEISMIDIEHLISLLDEAVCLDKNNKDFFLNCVVCGDKYNNSKNNSDTCNKCVERKFL